MLASFPASMLNHIYAKKGIPYRFILGQKDSSPARARNAARPFSQNLMVLTKGSRSRSLILHHRDHREEKGFSSLRIKASFHFSSVVSVISVVQNLGAGAHTRISMATPFTPIGIGNVARA